MQSRRILKSILSSVWSEHFVREKKLEQMDDLPAEKTDTITSILSMSILCQVRGTRVDIHRELHDTAAAIFMIHSEKMLNGHTRLWIKIETGSIVIRGRNNWVGGYRNEFLFQWYHARDPLTWTSLGSTTAREKLLRERSCDGWYGGVVYYWCCHFTVKLREHFAVRNVNQSEKDWSITKILTYILRCLVCSRLLGYYLSTCTYLIQWKNYYAYYVQLTTTM